MEAHRLIARRALSFLSRAGVRRSDGLLAAEGGAASERLTVTLAGPDLPDDVPAAVASPALVRDSIAWRGAYVLMITAPRNVFEIAWNPDEPVRIMAFSGGDWENTLVHLAAGTEDAS